MTHAQTAVELPARWIAGITLASAAACIPLAVAVAAAGIHLYERLVGPLSPAEAFQPARATKATPVPHSPRSVP